MLVRLVLIFYQYNSYTVYEFPLYCRNLCINFVYESTVYWTWIKSGHKIMFQGQIFCLWNSLFIQLVDVVAHWKAPDCCGRGPWLAGLGICSSVFRANRLFFAQKWVNERFAQKTRDSLICSFLVSDLSNLLTIPHFLWAMWANRSWLLIFGEQPEWFTHISHQKKGMSDSLIL